MADVFVVFAEPVGLAKCIRLLVFEFEFKAIDDDDEEEDEDEDDESLLLPFVIFFYLDFYVQTTFIELCNKFIKNVLLLKIRIE